jgi:glutamate-1-semialdehyde 2,1-aminomutase
MRHDKSISWYERAKRVIPGGICSNVRAISEPAPLFYERAEGAHIWDVDGNEYIDYVLGQGPMLLGYTPRSVIDAAKAQLEKGLVYAGQTELEVLAAERVRALVPCAEMVRFSSTGSEAVHAAVRLARAHTGRKKILRFEGHYHGWLDTIAWNYAAPKAELGPRENPPLWPSSLGQPVEDAANVLVRPWNDLSLVEDLFEREGGLIAAVICEPIMGNWCAITPEPGYLEGLCKLCDRYGALLIFDEVITGFRVALGGAQALYGVTPDLATFAKAMGGGMPVSAIAGRAAVMSLFGELRTVHAGTYNSNPVCMAGTVAALETLSADNGAELARAHASGKALMDGIRELAAKSGLPVTVRGVPPLFHVSFVPQGAPPVVDYRASFSTDFEMGRRFWIALQERGIRITSRGVWLVSTVHTREDVTRTLTAVADALEALKQ